MSKRAEERALEAYPDRTLFYSARECYKKGYEQAEKDLALTWEDVKRIVEIADSLMPFESVQLVDFEREFQSEEAYYKEVLKRFNDGKE